MCYNLISSYFLSRYFTLHYPFIFLSPEIPVLIVPALVLISAQSGLEAIWPGPETNYRKCSVIFLYAMNVFQRERTKEAAGQERKGKTKRNCAWEINDKGQWLLQMNRFWGNKDLKDLHI